MKKRPLILGHRGYRAKFPENTMLAFQKALDFGADGIECDVQKTNDGVFIVFHDDTTGRLTGVDGTIAVMDYAQITALRVNGEPIPRLSELVIACSHSYVNIELKGDTVTANDCPGILREISKTVQPESTMISSFHHHLLPYFRRHGYPIGMLVGDEYIQKGIIRLLWDIARLHPDHVNLPIGVFHYANRFVIKTTLSIMHLLGIKLVFWTVNSEDDFNTVIPFADCIITDEVEKTVVRVKNL